MKIKISILIALSPIFFFSSCRKEKDVCGGNCTTISIKGNVVNKTTGGGIPNISIMADWVKRSNFYPAYSVEETKTKADGSFIISATIDSLKFSDYFLLVKMPADTNFLISTYQNGSHFFENNYYSFLPDEWENINFDLYTKVPFTIHLHRTLADNFSNFGVGPNVADLNIGGYTLIYSPGPADTTLHVMTAPNVFTKVYQRKNFADYSFAEKTDSVICTAGGNNTININF